MNPVPSLPAARTPSPNPVGAVVAVALVTVDPESVGQRIDNFLLRHLKGVPRSHLYRVLRRGEVRVNKGRVKADYRLQAGDLVRIPPLRTAAVAEPVRAPDSQLARLAASVLFEDDRLLVLNKPAGLAVHGGSGLSYGLIESLRQLRPGAELELVHRLDRDTSGCLVVSKRRSTLRDLHELIRGGSMEKRYLALILGDLSSASLTVDAPLAKNVQQGGERLVKVDLADGKPARTIFKRLRRLSFAGPAGERSATLVEARLITGRTHQIRVHAAHLGTPLAGDPKYGDFEANRCLKSLGLGRLFLHASAVSFRAEYMDQPLRVEAPLPAELEQVLARLAGHHTVGELADESSPMSYALICFDWDGTLMDSQARIVDCLLAAFAEVGQPPPSREAAAEIIGLGLDEAMARLWPGADAGPAAPGCRHTIGSTSCSPMRPPSTLFQGARETLERLRAEGYLLAVATGKSRRGLDLSLAQTGLAGYFQATRCADETASKPHPRMLLELMDELDVGPAQTLMVGDTEYDMQLAANAGVGALAVCYGVHAPERLLACGPLACLDSLFAHPALVGQTS